MKKLSIKDMNRISTEEFKKTKKIPLTIVLDNIRSIYNVGSVFRTSDAFRIKKIILCGITSTPPSNDIHKTALGAEFSVDWEYSSNAKKAVKSLLNNNVIVYAIEQAHNSLKLQDLKLDTNKEYAIVMGNEVKGVQQEIVDLCNNCIEIPQEGTKHSLNVSVACGIVLWTFFSNLRNTL